MGVETGGCPHTAIREDASMNLAAIEDMNRKFPHAELCFVESGGDDLAATFSPELADLTIYVIDVAEGEKIRRKGGPGITRSDLLVINKINLAPLVGANLGVMEADTLRMRAKRPFVFTNFKSGEGVDQIAKFVIEKGRLAKESDTLIRYGEVKMGIISRGFSGRRSVGDAKLRPGQYLTTDFPDLSPGPTPPVPLVQWKFVIDDGT